MSRSLTVFGALALILAAASAAARAGEVPAEAAAAAKARRYAEAAKAAAGKAGAEILGDLEALAAGKKRVTGGVAAGKRPAVSVDFMGRPMRGKVKAADEDAITVDLRGMTRGFKWAEVSDRRFYNIVRRFSGDSAADHLLLARICAALKLAEEGEKEIVAAGSSEEARALRARIAALGPARGAPKPPRGGPAAASAQSKPKRTDDDAFKNVWVHAGRTSAAVYWQMDDMAREALSRVEYAETEACEKSTEKTRVARWSHLHRLAGLEGGKSYSYRLVLDSGGKEIRSSVRTFETKAHEGATEIKGGTRTVTLGRSGTYILTGDVTSSGTGIEITAANVTLEMDGHKVVYSKGGTRRCHGVLVSAAGAKVYNGVVEQARPGAERCYSLGSFGQAKGLVAAGLSLHCNAKSSYPLSLINGVVDSDIHHNWCESDTVLLKSRHYPGNDIVRLDTSGGVNRIHHNILLKGCHRGMAFHGKGGETHVYENEIASDQGYVNGYTINCTGNMKIYRNRIKSCSRGMHVTASNIEIYDNWLDLHQHQVFDDRPQGSTNYRHYYTENHGIKLESPGTNVKIHGNFVRSTQPQPDPGAKQRFSNALSATGARIEERSGMKGDRDHYAPATPLNFHSTKNSDVEVYKNTFVAVTTYRQSKQGRGYGISGEWAAAIRAAGAFRGRLHIHDNVFKSNDIFVNGREWSSGIRLEKNRFVLLPGATSNHRAVNGGAAAGALRSGGNTFEGQSP